MNTCLNKIGFTGIIRFYPLSGVRKNNNKTPFIRYRDIDIVNSGNIKKICKWKVGKKREKWYILNMMAFANTIIDGRPKVICWTRGYPIIAIALTCTCILKSFRTLRLIKVKELLHYSLL